VFIKAVKFLGFTRKLTDILQGLRVKELKIAALFRRLLCARVFFGTLRIPPLERLIGF
jgi:ATP-binding cassette subfamily C (CFTR/MRP) protein 1